MDAESRGEYAAALGYLQRLAPLLEAGGGAEEVTKFIARMQRLTAVDDGAKPITAAAELPAADDAPVSLKIQVTVAPKLAEKIRPDDTIYLIAKATADAKIPSR